MKFILEKPMLPHSAFYVSTGMEGLVLWTDYPELAYTFRSQESAEAMRCALGRDVVVSCAKGNAP